MKLFKSSLEALRPKKHLASLYFCMNRAKDAIIRRVLVVFEFVFVLKVDLLSPSSSLVKVFLMDGMEDWLKFLRSELDFRMLAIFFSIGFNRDYFN